MTKITLLVGAAALSLSPLLALPASADTAAEITIATTHAGFASTQSSIDKVHAHLHHVLNCLVGPKGEGFDAAAGNPCAKAGNGAIPDTKDAAQKTKLEAVLARVKAGIASNDLADAKSEAERAKDALAMANMKGM
jgi:hypothetical protein